MKVLSTDGLTELIQLTKDNFISNSETVQATIGTLATVATTGAYSDLSGTPTLATVATSGSYADLSNTPTIGDGKTIFKKNGTAFSTITANQTSTTNVDYTIPTAVTDLTDAANYQSVLVSGTNIKTVNNQSLLGSGNISISGGGTSYSAGTGIDSTALGNGTIQVSTTIASKTDIGDGSIVFTQNNTPVGTITANQTSSSTINVDNTTYSAGTGITINSSNTIATTSSVLVNTATGTNALTINGTAASQYLALNIGYQSSAGECSTAIGTGAEASGTGSMALGGYYQSGTQAKATAMNAIQIGKGTNSTANSLQVYSYQLLDTSTGYIPNARINMDTTVTSASTNAVTSGAVYTALGDKQDSLVSGTSIKTINNTSLLGSGDITVVTDISGKADVDLSNMSASQSAINTIVGWGMPDYANGITVNYTTGQTEQSYIAPNDGYFAYSICSINLNHPAYINVNTIRAVYENSTSGTTGSVLTSGHIRVSKNDVLTFWSNYASGNHTWFCFFPMKGAN